MTETYREGVVERILRRVTVTEAGCWELPPRALTRGYPVFSVFVLEQGRWRQRAAHLIMWGFEFLRGHSRPLLARGGVESKAGNQHDGVHTVDRAIHHR